jgi:undecaprenyl-diphosphatase
VRAVNWWRAGVLGVTQGLTEFLPVSSSAHLRVLAALAGWPDPGAAFSAVSQIGTEAAVLLYFREDLTRIAVGWARSLTDPAARGSDEARLGWLILAGTVPICAVGVALKDRIAGPFRDPRLTAASLIAFGLVLGAADARAAAGDAPPPGPAARGRRRGTGRRGRSMEELTVRDGLLFGLAQALALIPGVSRSGATVSGGLLLGYTREAASRYSFLLAIPAVLTSGLYGLKEVLDAPSTSQTGEADWGTTAFATATAFGVGYATIGWFMRHVAAGDLAPFVRYRVALGVLLLALAATGRLGPTASPGREPA